MQVVKRERSVMRRTGEKDVEDGAYKCSPEFHIKRRRCETPQNSKKQNSYTTHLKKNETKKVVQSTKPIAAPHAVCGGHRGISLLLMPDYRTTSTPHARLYGYISAATAF